MGFQLLKKVTRMVNVNNMRKIDFLYLFVIVWMGLFLIRGCKYEDQMHKNYKILEDSVKTYKSKNGELIHYNNVIVTDLEDMKHYNDGLLVELNEMKIKKPTVVVKNVMQFRVDTISYVFTDTLPCEDFTKLIEIDSTYYKLSMTINKDSLIVNNIIVPNTQTLVVGIKKNGLFKKNEYVFAIKNTNPYIVSSEIEPYVINEKKKFFERPIVNIAIGAGLAIAFTFLTK